MKRICLLIISTCLFANELEVDGNLKLQGDLIFQDETLINTAPSLPPGVIMPYAGSNPPQGWLLCNGQEVSRTEYEDLFSILLITYGFGDQITTFNLPDLRGRMLLGADNMGGSSAGNIESDQGSIIGGKAGQEMHQLTVDEMPSHNHYLQNQYGSNGFNQVGIGGSNVADGIYTNHTGGSQPHNNMPPYLTVNYIIKY